MPLGRDKMAHNTAPPPSTSDTFDCDITDLRRLDRTHVQMAMKGLKGTNDKTLEPYCRHFFSVEGVTESLLRSLRLDLRILNGLMQNDYSLTLLHPNCIKMSIIPCQAVLSRIRDQELTFLKTILGYSNRKHY